MSDSHEAIEKARERLNAEYATTNAKLRKYRDDLQPKARAKYHTAQTLLKNFARTYDPTFTRELHKEKFEALSADRKNIKNANARLQEKIEQLLDSELFLSQELMELDRRSTIVQDKLLQQKEAKVRADNISAMLERQQHQQTGEQKKQPTQQKQTVHRQSQDDTCTICLDADKNENRINEKVTSCKNNHKFHSECLIEWILTQRSRNQPPDCPNCREELTSVKCQEVEKSLARVQMRRQERQIAKQNKKMKEKQTRRKEEALRRQKEQAEREQKSEKDEKKYIDELGKRGAAQAEKIRQDEADAKRQLDTEKAEKDKRKRQLTEKNKRKKKEKQKIQKKEYEQRQQKRKQQKAQLVLEEEYEQPEELQEPENRNLVPDWVCLRMLSCREKYRNISLLSCCFLALICLVVVFYSVYSYIMLTKLLHLCSVGNTEQVSLLLEQECNIMSHETSTPNKIYDCSFDVNMYSTYDYTPLITSSANGHLDIVKLLLNVNEIKVNRPDSFGATAIYMASQNNHVDVVEVLLSHSDLDINKIIGSGSSALYIASQKGHVEVVRLLLSNSDLDVNKAMGSGVSVLYIASQQGHVEVVRLLISKSDIDINKANDKGATALMIASALGHLEVVRLLLSKSDIDINKAMDGGATPLFIAYQKGHAEVVRLLVSKSEIDNEL